MNPKALFKAQAALEGLRFNDDGYLERWKDMPGESGPPARVVVADYGHEQCVYFGNGIDRRAEELICSLPAHTLLKGDRRVFDILNRQKEVEGYAEYWTYTVSEAGIIPPSPMIQRLSSRNELLRGFSAGFFGISYEDIFAAIVEGIVVSAATSSREDEALAEAWVFTLPEHRRQGYAVQATAAWLRSMTNRGLTPFYSHVKDNVSSRRLAESLQLHLCFVLACYP